MNHKARILIVDDHRGVREMLARLLDLEPDVELVGKASGGTEAVELTRIVRPDVIVMDVQMEDMGGVEATRRILAERPDVRVIGTSMNDDAAIEMKRAGATESVCKTDGPRRLLSAIRGRAAAPSASPELV